MLQKSTIQETKKEYGRGIIGGILFSLPLLYTMEVWWRGFTAPPAYLMAWIAVTYLLLLGYNSFAGMRKDASFMEVCWDSFEEIGLSIFVSFIFLLLIGKISFGMSLYEVTGKVIIECMLVAIGISVGTSQLGISSKNGSNNGGSGEMSVQKKLARMFVLSICGAVLVSSSLAPTEEILLIAAEVGNLRLLFMIVISLLLSLAVLYMTDFKGTGEKKINNISFVGAEVAVSYFAALLVSAGLLYFFGRFENRGLWIILAQIIVLGVPAGLGASAGRLLIAK